MPAAIGCLFIAAAAAAAAAAGEAEQQQLLRPLPSANPANGSLVGLDGLGQSEAELDEGMQILDYDNLFLEDFFNCTINGTVYVVNGSLERNVTCDNDAVANRSLDRNVTIGHDTENTYYLLPWWRQLIWSVAFVAMATVSTCGNLIVIWIVMSHKRMRTVTNYFIVNLSIADTMVSSLNVTFNFIYMLTGHWPFGNIYCKICSFISILSVCGSVFTLVAISVDRYNAIIRPLSPRMSRPTTILIAVAIWLMGMLIALPQWFYFHAKEEGGNVICISEWPDGQMNDSKWEFWYNVFFMVLTYFLPMHVMSIIYAKIGRELWGSKAIGEATEVQKESIKSKRRVVKMMIMVVIIFGVCWLPYHIYFILSNTHPAINFSPYIQEIYLAIYWLAMSNSMYNPMIYCFMNNRFRQGFLRVFRFFFRSSSSANDSGDHGQINLQDIPSEMRLNPSRYAASNPSHGFSNASNVGWRNCSNASNAGGGRRSNGTARSPQRGGNTVTSKGSGGASIHAVNPDLCRLDPSERPRYTAELSAATNGDSGYRSSTGDRGNQVTSEADSNGRARVGEPFKRTIL